jgi:hypothetical protein
MENKKKLSAEERERILVIVRKSAERYRETNHILDMILPDFPENEPNYQHTFAKTER